MEPFDVFAAHLFEYGDALVGSHRRPELAVGASFFLE